MKTPNFLRALMSSPAYMDKNSNEYVMAERYLRMLYPGMVQTDATGRMMSPAYDMTLKQFYDAQMDFDEQLEEAIEEAESDDAEEYVEIEEIIDVKVLMPWGTIEDKKLYVYTLNEPDDKWPKPEKDKLKQYGVGTVKRATAPVTNARRAMAKHMKAQPTFRKYRCIPTVVAVLQRMK